MTEEIRKLACMMKDVAAVNLAEPSPGDLERVVTAYREMRVAFKEVISVLEHAVHLEYLGEGSTDNWAKDILKKYGILEDSFKHGGYSASTPEKTTVEKG